MFLCVFQINHRTKIGHGFQFANCHKLPEAFPTKVSPNGQPSRLVFIELPTERKTSTMWESRLMSLDTGGPISEIVEGYQAQRNKMKDAPFFFIIYCQYVYVFYM